MSIYRFGKALKLRLAFVSLFILVLAVAGCANQSGASQPQVATQAPAVATEVAPTTAPAATEMATAAPAATAATAMTGTTTMTGTTAVTGTTATTGTTGTTVTTPATVMISSNSKLGDILTDDKGMTLYLFTKDTKNTSNCYDKCATAWPPLLTAGAPKAGTGADASLLGTTTRKDGTTQVTYNGWPVYYFAKDKAAGDVTGQDVGGVWYVLNAKGEQVQTPAGSSSTPSAAATAATSSGTGTSTTVTSTTSMSVTTPATVMISTNSKFGDILTDDKGMTLYLYTKDTKNTSNCYDKCATAWPPLLTAGAPKAGMGADTSLLGTTTRKDGTTQVTYNSWPVYYWFKDKQPGDATGQGVGGVWYVLNAKGEEVETPGASSAAPASGGNSSSSSSGASSSAQGAGKTVNVVIKDFSFGQPLTVAIGTTVTWTNQDSAAHTVTASDKSFDSGSINPGATFSFTFTKAGTYNYVCQFHPNMKGTVTVTG